MQRTGADARVGARVPGAPVPRHPPWRLVFVLAQAARPNSSAPAAICPAWPIFLPDSIVAPPSSIAPSESSAAGDTDGSCVVLSDPHASRGEFRFPFLIIEVKGLSTSGNLIEAQNQAAGGGASASRLLESLIAQDAIADTESGAPRIVFSVTTEGAMHGLWVHYAMLADKKMGSGTA